LAFRQENVMTNSRADRIDLFRNLHSQATQPQFWEIVEVRAYLDSMMVDYTIQRNEVAKQ
jgi:hypothetical protein